MLEMKLIFDNEVLEGMIMEVMTVSPSDPTKGILVMSQGLKNIFDPVVFRIYLLEWLQESDGFNVEKELAAFEFDTSKKAYEFLSHLPEMSAIDLLLLQSESHTYI
jgi:hypothetical protein